MKWKIFQMDNENRLIVSKKRRFAAWMVHLFTATGAVFSLLSLNAIFWQNYISALWLMAAAVVIDSMDGMMARAVHTKEVVPEIDGALLDNIIDYVNYVIVPSFFIIESSLLPYGFRIVSAGLIAFVSAYQFSQIDAKTEDHFFKGFPSYWNIVVFYLYVWKTPQWVNLGLITLLCGMVFVPIKYAYLSQPHYLVQSRPFKYGILLITVLWALACAGSLWLYPISNCILSFISVGYIFLYISLSIFRTYKPIKRCQETELV